MVSAGHNLYFKIRPIVPPSIGHISFIAFVALLVRASVLFDTNFLVTFRKFIRFIAMLAIVSLVKFWGAMFCSLFIFIFLYMVAYVKLLLF